MKPHIVGPHGAFTVTVSDEDESKENRIYEIRETHGYNNSIQLTGLELADLAKYAKKEGLI